MSAKRALVLSYSPIARDPRVRRQIQWLSSRGFEVEVCGLGPAPFTGEAAYVEIEMPSLLQRIVIYLLLPPRIRANIMVTRPLRGLLSRLDDSSGPNLILLNDLDFLSVDALFSSRKTRPAEVVLDLHEYFYDLGGSVIWNLFNSRYYSWLLAFLETREFRSVMTVSEEIAELYEEKLGRRIRTVLNVPIPSDPDPYPSIISAGPTLEKIRIIHHGVFGRGRGIWRMIGAMKLVRGSAELHLMLVGSRPKRLFVQIWISFLRLGDKVFLVNPVEFEKINAKLSDFDLGLIFFHPPHSTSVRLAMPNKLFEFLKAGLGLVVGPNPSMNKILEKWNLGVVSESWNRRDLAAVIDSLDRQKVDSFKKNSVMAYAQFTSEALRSNFFQALDLEDLP